MSAMEFDLLKLEEFDTPTICNALELVEPERRRFGYTVENVCCVNENTAPRVGVVFTATMRSLDYPPLSGDDLKRERLRYYEYMSGGDPDVPKICLMQDLDGREAGRGPFWGEFNTRVHRALGFRAIVTDGSVRDVTMLPDDILILARGLRPSHSLVHIVDFGGQVNVFGMVASHGDIVHADQHGAVTFPRHLAPEVAERAVEFMESEAPVLDACKQGSLTFDELSRLYMERRAIGQPSTEDQSR
ncbi:MAG: RraA family protein [Acidimicrobiales bacterium]|nr:RraA family protein [Acidimicrobiales bacterium]